MIRKLNLIIIALLLFAAQSAFASYSVTIDTSSLTSTSGFLDMNFGADPLIGSTGASATVQSFALNGGALDPSGPDSLSGGYTGGPLSSPVTFPDSTANDYFQGITTFGNSITFILNLSGSSGTFQFSLLDSSFSPLLSSDPLSYGRLFTVDLNGADLPIVTSFATDPKGTTVAPVPLPQAFWLVVTGLAGIVGIRRSRRA